MPMPAKTTADYRHAGQKAAAALRKEKKEPVVTDKQRELIHAMVFEGYSRKKAAEEAGITDKAAREAMLKPNVLAYLNECMDVLRTGLRPRALHTMGELLESKNDSTKFKAAEYLDGMNRSTHQIGATVNVQVNNTVNVTPGYVLDLRPEDMGGNGVQIEHLENDEVIELEALTGVPEDD